MQLERNSLIHPSLESDRHQLFGDFAAAILDTIEAGFFVVDADWQLQYANGRGREMLGLPNASVIGQNLWQRFPQLRESRAGDRLQEAARARRNVEFETFYPMLRSWLHVRVCPLPNHLIGVYLRNIDERKRKESELRASEERLKIASQAAQLGYWERDLQTSELRSSDQCKANYGLPPDAELSYAAVFASIDPNYREDAREASRRAVIEGIAYESEYPIIWPDGSSHWISVRGTCIYAEDGTPLRTVGISQDITERKRAEQALLESEERFRRVFEQSPLGKAIAGPDGRLRDVNPALCGMLGYCRDELGGLALFDMAHPDDRENCRLQTDALVRGERERIQLEMRFVRRSGEIIWASVNVAPVRDAEGRLLCTLGVIEDISGRKRLEQELKESEQRYRLFAEAATEGVLVHDFHTVLDVSGRFAEMFGYRREDLIGSRLSDWPMLVQPDVLAGALQLGQQGQVPRNELACRRCDGTPIALEYAAKDISYSGRPVRIVIARDITERKRDEQRLNQLNDLLEKEAEQRARQLFATRARLRAFFENSPDRLTLQRATADGRFLYEDINPSSERGFGLPRERVIGRAVEEVLGAEAARVPVHYFRECLRTGAPQHYIVRRTTAGRTRTLDVMAVPVPGEFDGGDRFIITSARDITEHEQLEAQLRQAQKMEAVGQLTGGVAHDFNNLLTAVVSSLELIRDKTSEERVRGLAEMALRAAMRGGQLTHQLLSFSRRQNLQPSVVDLNALVRESEALLRRAVGEAIDLLLDSEPGLWPCEVDPAQFAAAVMNLVVNARDAMPNGGRLVLATGNIEIRPGEGGLDLPVGDYVMLGVSDTGEGMSEQVLAHAFEPFFTTKEVGKGSGLGLSMVHGFARQSGGTVRVDSELGHGTTVRLYLPRAWVSPEDAAPSEPKSRIALPRATGTVLVVEDNEEVLQATVDVLRSLRYRVFVAASGPQAMEVIRRGEPVDLLLTDVVMPGGLNGIELAHQARQLRPSLRVLLTSGYTAEAFVGSGEEPSFPFLAKPYGPSQLGRRVCELLQSSPAEPSAAAPV